MYTFKYVHILVMTSPPLGENNIFSLISIFGSMRIPPGKLATRLGLCRCHPTPVASYTAIEKGLSPGPSLGVFGDSVAGEKHWPMLRQGDGFFGV